MSRPVDITGQKFNALTAISPTSERCSEGILWRCKCDCGNHCLVSAKSLRNGNTKSCGCLRRKDITGQRFGRLVAIAPTDKRKENSIVWICKCDCGKCVEVPAVSLMKGNTKSCGCLMVDTGRKNGLNPTDAIDGTRTSALGKTLFATNRSGVRGVSWSKQKKDWEAYIKFKGVYYHLGHFKNIEDAAKARARAEENLFENFKKWYEEYRKTTPPRP